MENLERAIKYLELERIKLMRIYKERYEKSTKAEIKHMANTIEQLSEQKRNLETLLKDMYHGHEIRNY